jgi:hypothetical protein
LIRQVEDHAEQQFNIFKLKFNKSYVTKEEHDYRFGVFKENLKFVEEMNKLNKAAHKNYELGIQEFSDLTLQEFSATHTGLRVKDETPITHSWMPSAEETLQIIIGLSFSLVILLITRL